MAGAGREVVHEITVVLGKTRLATAEAGDFLAAMRAKSREGGVAWETNRRVRADILRDTGSVAHLTVEFVLVDAVGAGGLADVAGAAGEHQLIGSTILFGVEQVGAEEDVSVLILGP